MKLFSDTDLQELTRSASRILGLMGKFKNAMSERDAVFLALGLRAAHMEEALAHGELERAKAHFEKLVGVVKEARL